MKYWLASVLLILGVNLNIAQNKIKGNKNVISIETSLNHFNALSIGESFDINLTKSNSPFIEIETDENLHDVIHFEVIDSTFRINTSAKIRSKKKLNITLGYTDEINFIEVKDNAKLQSSNNISSDTISILLFDYGKINLDITSKLFNLKQENRLKLNSKSTLNILSDFTNIELSESSKLNAFINSDSIQINMKDNSRMDLEGSTKNAIVNLKGSADLLAKTFSIITCRAMLKEESDFTAQITDSIILNSAGISETYLYGNPKIIIENFADKSKLHKKEL